MRARSPSVSNIHESKNFINDKEFYQSPTWKRLSKACKQRDRYTCKLCKKRSKNKYDRHKFHADHIIPRSRGGEDSVNNLRCLCEGCHAEKHPHLARAIATRDARAYASNNKSPKPNVPAFRPKRLYNERNPGSPSTSRAVRGQTKSRLY